MTQKATGNSVKNFRKPRKFSSIATQSRQFYLKLSLCVLSVSVVSDPETSVSRETFQL
jgi:hypothetical protein